MRAEENRVFGRFRRDGEESAYVLRRELQKTMDSQAGVYRTGSDLAEALSKIKELKERKDTLYVGGPVALNRMLLLVGTPQLPEESQEVTQDVYISSSWKVLERLMKNAAKDERFRIFAGYAGWAPNQLDFEKSRGDWHVLKADAETVFDKKPSEIWQELILRASVKWVRVHAPFRIKRR